MQLGLCAISDGDPKGVMQAPNQCRGKRSGRLPTAGENTFVLISFSLREFCE